MHVGEGKRTFEKKSILREDCDGIYQAISVSETWLRYTEGRYRTAFLGRTLRDGEVLQRNWHTFFLGREPYSKLTPRHHGVKDSGTMA